MSAAGPVVVTTAGELRAEVDRRRAGGAGPVGLVPTMGALHQGHAALVRAARQANDVVVVSVFVNPIQFTDLGDCADFRDYPRDLDADVELLAGLGVDVVFAPAVEEMYPDGVPQVWVRTGRMGQVLEGASRPGHFDGVATVVTKLFSLVRPDNAYFGQKDAQQVSVVRRTVADLELGVEVTAVPVVRAADGLAESSRNRHLSAEERRRALALSRTLARLRERVRAGAPPRLAEARAQLAAAEGVDLDYLEIVDSATFTAAESGDLALVAAQVGSTRLIDNMPLR